MPEVTWAETISNLALPPILGAHGQTLGWQISGMLAIMDSPIPHCAPATKLAR